MENKEFKRELSLKYATILNIIDMVGIGPFVTLPIIMLVFPGQWSIVPWIIGAIISLLDGFIWSELGSRWPKAGGSYVFLQKIYTSKFGRFFAFLYSLQTSLHLPFVLTSACLGLINYLRYLIPLDYWQGKFIMIAMIVIIIFLLYRNILKIGKIGYWLSFFVFGMLLFTIFTGFISFDANTLHQNTQSFKPLGEFWSFAFWFAMGNATTKTVYSFLGYYNVCHIGSEIKSPEKNIPKSIMISIIVIAVLYLAMQFSVSGAIPQSWITDENVPVVSLLMEKVYGRSVAVGTSFVIIIIAISSLFALFLGYSRIIYTSATEGFHFKFLTHLHPKHHFPDYILLFFGAIAIVFCFIFDQPSDVFKFIVVSRIFIQFIPQAIGIIYMRMNKVDYEGLFKMPLFPIISVISWLFIFFTTGLKYSIFGLGLFAIGGILYVLLIKKDKNNS